MEDLISKGVSPERAEVCIHRVLKDAERYAKPTHMTDEMAEHIVRSNIVKQEMLRMVCLLQKLLSNLMRKTR